MLKLIRGILVRVVVFIAVAVGTAILVNKINNMNMDKVSAEMEDSRLPIVFCEYNGKAVNLMKGYTQTMSTRLMRDGIIPLNENHGVDILVYDDSGYGTAYSYELRTIDGESLIEHGDITSSSERGGYVEYNISLRMDTKENKEYVLVFVITDESGEQVKYYTRVVQLEEEYADKAIDFAYEFHNTTFIKEVDEEEGNFVYDLLDTTEQGRDDDLSHVNLNSSYEMVSFAGMDIAVMTAIIPKIVELDREFTAINLSYVVENDQEGCEHYYNISENYSMRYNRYDEKMELLAFDRYQESIFDADYISKDRNSISLGITDIDSVEYASSNKNKLIAFVKEGQLWLYDYETANLTNVFDMLQGKYSDIRCLNSQIDINIASLDDEGNMYFVVYGYFCRGRHEGKNGISLYYYSNEDAKIEEKCFVQSNEPFEVMKSEVGRFSYYDEAAGYMYYLLNGAIYRVDLNKMTQDAICEGIPSQKYYVSSNRKIVVYPDSKREEDVKSLVLRNFETGYVTDISGGERDRFLALGFVDNDLIYGVADRGDITFAAGKQAIMPLNMLYIKDENGNDIKTYHKPGTYIMEVNITSENIYLSRAVKNNNFFEETEPDYISCKKNPDTSKTQLKYSYDDAMLNIVDIALPENMYIDADYNPIMTKTRDYEGYKEMVVLASAEDAGFSVFDNQGYLDEFDSAGLAIKYVNNCSSGIVVDGDGNTIYRKLDAISYNTVADKIKEISCDSIEKTLLTCAYMCISTINSKADYNEVISSSSFEDAFLNNSNGVGMNISGIELDTALYFLDRDVPFVARIDDGRYVLVISYNSTHIRYYDPFADGEVKVTRENFSDSLSLWGNEMYAYTSQ